MGVEQQLSLAHLGVLRVSAMAVRADVDVHHPHLAVLDARVAVAQVDPALADRLDLGAQQRDAALPRFEHVIVVARFAVLGNHAPGLLALGLLGHPSMLQHPHPPHLRTPAPPHLNVGYPDPVRLSTALAQANPTVGDVQGSLALVRRARQDAAALGADLVVFSELVLVGYPPEDLVLRPAFVQAAAAGLRELQHETAAGGPGLVVTLPWAQDGHVFNAVALVADGRTDLRFKRDLPNYGVFDEKRVFTPGPLPEPVDFRGVRLGLPVCEDVWYPDCVARLAVAGAQLLLVPNGSPFEVEKFHQRLDLARHRVSESGLALAYVNQVGGQDELVFDGGSFVMNAAGALTHVLPFWREALVLTTWECRSGRYVPIGPPSPDTAS